MCVELHSTIWGGSVPLETFTSQNEGGGMSAASMNFSGHETFPLRYGWLKKVADAFTAADDEAAEKAVFASDNAIAHFGVGKNMVRSMRHWALSTGITDTVAHGHYRLSDFGRFLLSDGGFDPYLERPESLWLIHWHLATNHEEKTTLYYAFNRYNGVRFSKDDLLTGLKHYVAQQDSNGVAEKTLKVDIDCFINTYLPKHRHKTQVSEGSLESPLSELGLLQETAERAFYEFRIGEKRSLSDTVLKYALTDFIDREISEETVSIERLAHDPGSPGQVFKMDESSLADRLTKIEQAPDSIFQWAETAGLRQIAITDRSVAPQDFLIAPMMETGEMTS